MSGLFGVTSSIDCPQILFYGTDYQSHLGTQKAGLAVLNHRIYRSIHNISTSQFKSRFGDEIKKMKGSMGIGVISDNEPQPIIISSSFGTFALVTSGLLVNKNQLVRQIMKQGGSFSELSGGQINPTEVVGKIIAQKENVVEGIRHLFSQTKGSLCLLVLTKKGIYAARDPMGRSTLVVGQKGSSLAVSSETCAFPNLGYRVHSELSPGQIVLLAPNGLLQSQYPGHKSKKVCSFLWIYTGYPASSYEGISVEAVRERSGINLAKHDTVSADFVTGVPDSGIAHAIGYTIQSGIPYRRALVKYTPGYGRSYTPPSQNTRDQVAQMKLIPVPQIIKGQKIVICDDSIVRGTQLKNQAIKKLWDCGAREIHVRIACPPLMFPCPYLLSTRKISELAARRAIDKTFKNPPSSLEPFLDPSSLSYRKMNEYLRQELGVTSLVYQSVPSMVQAIGLPQTQLCLHCWQGQKKKEPILAEMPGNDPGSEYRL